MGRGWSSLATVAAVRVPRGVNKGQLTSTSGTSPAHLGDGCHGYGPGGNRVHPLWETCSETGQCGGGGGGVRTSRTVSWAVTMLSHLFSCIHEQHSGSCGRYRASQRTHLSSPIPCFPFCLNRKLKNGNK